ncbi:MAG: hypothetical protein ACKV2T_16070 [Kofleriaceae bacterium]
MRIELVLVLAVVACGDTSARLDQGTPPLEVHDAPQAPPPAGPVSIDFNFSTLAENTLPFHAGFSYMQEHLVVDLQFSTIADYELQFRANGKRHEPYQDNFCFVQAEPLGDQTLFTAICSRRRSEAAGGYMLPVSATLLVRRIGQDEHIVDFSFATEATHSSGIHAGFRYLQEHVVVAIPATSIAAYQLLVRESDATHQTFVDNYCGVTAEPIDNQTLFTVICKRSESRSAGGYIMPTTARVAFTTNASTFDFTVDTIAPNTLAFHQGHDYLQSHIEIPIPFGELADAQLLLPVADSTSEPEQDHYCNLWMEALGEGTLLTSICSRRTSASGGGFMLPASLRVVARIDAEQP